MPESYGNNLFGLGCEVLFFLSRSLASDEKGRVLYTLTGVSGCFFSVLIKLLTVTWTMLPLIVLINLSSAGFCYFSPKELIFD